MARTFAIAGILAVFALVCYEAFFQPRITGSFGLDQGGAGAAGSPADSAGIRRGDTVHPQHDMNVMEFYPSPGQRVVFVVEHGGVRRVVALTAAPRRVPLNISDWVIFAVLMVDLTIALLLVVRKWEDRDARVLALFLGAKSCTGWSYVWTGVLAAFSLPFTSAMNWLGTAALLFFVGTYPSSAPSRGLRRALAVVAAPLALALAALGAAETIAFGVFNVAFGITGPTYRALGAIFGEALPAIGLAYGAATLPEPHRKRVQVLFSFYVVGISGPLIYDLLLATTPIPNARIHWLLATLIVSSIGFAYVLFKHRLFDLGFVLNRAAVYGVISTILLPLLVGLEWAVERYVSAQNRAENAVLQVGIALLLFYSMRRLHGRAERFVDEVFFRERHLKETALRNFARDVVYVTDAASVVDLAVQTVRSSTNAQWVAVYTQSDGLSDYVLRAFGGSGSAVATIGENDRAVVAMRATRSTADHVPQAALPDALILPCMALGRLSGFLACGPRETGDAYAPDELDALVYVAAAVGMALDGLRLAELERRAALTV